jgi:hypothetical protein
MPSWIDGVLYPDRETPERIGSLAERIDFVARLCAAWDWGILPREETIRQVRRPAWRRAVDECRLLTSPAYHLLRRWHHLPPLPYLGQQLAYIRDDPNLIHV